MQVGFTGSCFDVRRWRMLSMFPNVHSHQVAPVAPSFLQHGRARDDHALFFFFYFFFLGIRDVIRLLLLLVVCWIFSEHLWAAVAGFHGGPLPRRAWISTHFFPQEERKDACVCFPSLFF